MNPPGHGAQCITFSCTRPRASSWRRFSSRFSPFACRGVCAYPVRTECGHACGVQEAEIYTGHVRTRVDHTRGDDPGGAGPCGAAGACLSSSMYV